MGNNKIKIHVINSNQIHKLFTIDIKGDHYHAMVFTEDTNNDNFSRLLEMIQEVLYKLKSIFSEPKELPTCKRIDICISTFKN